MRFMTLLRGEESSASNAPSSEKRAMRSLRSSRTPTPKEPHEGRDIPQQYITQVIWKRYTRVIHFPRKGKYPIHRKCCWTGKVAWQREKEKNRYDTDRSTDPTSRPVARIP